MGTLLLIFFIFFIVIPIVRIAVAAYTVRRKMRDAMRQQGRLEPTVGIVVAFILLMGLLMVCNLPMFSLKMSDFSLRNNFVRYIVIAAAVIFVATMGVAGFAATILLYIVVSVLQRVVRITTD